MILRQHLLASAAQLPLVLGFLPLALAPLLRRVSAYQIARSLRFNDDDSAHLSITFGGAGNTNKFSLSLWVKRGNLGITAPLVSYNAVDFIQFNSSDQLDIQFNATVGGQVKTNRVFRDSSAWMHILVAIDTTQATAANRVRVYVNGVEETSFATASYPSQNYTLLGFNAALLTYIGRNSTNYFDGYMAEVIGVDATQCTPDQFGSSNVTTGVWDPVLPSVTYGTNGWRLDFSDNSGTTSTTLGADRSGNSNNWTPNNFSVTAGVGNDSLVDTPTNYGDDTGVGGEVRGNYPVMVPIGQGTLTYPTTLSNGGLKHTNAAGGFGGNFSSFGAHSGKFYAEATDTAGSGNVERIGVLTGSPSQNPDAEFASSNEWAPGSFGSPSKSNAVNYLGSGRLDVNGGNTPSWGSTYTTNDIIGVAFDADTGKVWFAKNNVWQASGDPGAGTSPAATLTVKGAFHFFAALANSGAYEWNFGQRPFAYTAPSGFKALCTQNLAAPTIAKPSSYFDADTYTGTGATRSKTGVGFQPDLVWFKGRSGATDHALYDAVRGVEKRLETNNTDVEVTGDTTGLTAFNADGYTQGALAQINTSAATYVGWMWKEGVTPGLDIVSYAGTGSAHAINHSLGVAPKLIIIKRRDVAAADWVVGQSINGWTGQMYLDTTGAFSTNSGSFNDTAPTSTQFTVGTDNTVNNASSNYIAYLFAEIAGFSRISYYVGNGNAAGPFVWCGFRPKFVLIKITSGANDWAIYDTIRSPLNSTSAYLAPDLAAAEGSSSHEIDLLSNGFKVRNANGYINLSGATYIFAAFAENPFNYARAR